MRLTCVSSVREVTTAFGPHTLSRIWPRESSRPTLRRNSTERSKSFAVSSTTRSFAHHRARLAVDAVYVQFEDLRLLGAVLAAPGDGFQSRDQLQPAYRLDHIVVCPWRSAVTTSSSRLRAVTNRIGSADCWLAADALEHVDAADVGQIPVQHQDIEAFLVERADQRLAAIEVVAVVPRQLEPVAEQLRLGRIVLDDSYAHAWLQAQPAQVVRGCGLHFRIFQGGRVHLSKCHAQARKELLDGRELLPQRAFVMGDCGTLERRTEGGQLRKAEPLPGAL